VLTNQKKFTVEEAAALSFPAWEAISEEGGISSERYSTNKPIAYQQVCTIMDTLVNKESLLFIQDLENCN
jgi:hypothetical protein